MPNNLKSEIRMADMKLGEWYLVKVKVAQGRRTFTCWPTRPMLLVDKRSGGKLVMQHPVVVSKVPWSARGEHMLAENTATKWKLVEVSSTQVIRRVEAPAPFAPGRRVAA